MPDVIKRACMTYEGHVWQWAFSLDVYGPSQTLRGQFMFPVECILVGIDGSVGCAYDW